MTTETLIAAIHEVIAEFTEKSGVLFWCDVAWTEYSTPQAARDDLVAKIAERVEDLIGRETPA